MKRVLVVVLAVVGLLFANGIVYADLDGLWEIYYNPGSGSEIQFDVDPNGNGFTGYYASSSNSSVFTGTTYFGRGTRIVHILQEHNDYYNTLSGVFLNESKIIGNSFDVGDNSQEYYKYQFCMAKVGSGETCSQSDFDSSGSSSGSGFTQTDLDAQYQAGMDYCKSNPSDCGISTGGGTSCPSTGEGIDLNLDFSFTVPTLSYSPPIGTAFDLQATFKFYKEEGGKLLWELGDYSMK